MTNRIQIAFFDLDGTLVPFGKKEMNAPVKDALNRLQQNGTMLFAATGRPPYFVQNFEGIHWDGQMCFNGSYSFNEKEVIYSSGLSHQDVMTVIGNLERLNVPYAAAGAEECAASGWQKELEEYFEFSRHHLNVVSDEKMKSLVSQEVYQMMAAVPASMDKEVLRGTVNCRIVRWWDKAVDLIPADCGKAAGMEKILQYYDISRENCIAFGDGGNDIDMIEDAGIGVAMGNADQQVKSAADYVTQDCDHDGVRTALQHFGLI